MPIQGTPWHIETHFDKEYESILDCPYYDGASQYCSLFHGGCMGLRHCQMQSNRFGLDLTTNASIWNEAFALKTEDQIIAETAKSIGLTVPEWRDYTFQLYLRMLDFHHMHRYLPDIMDTEPVLLEYMKVVSSRRRKRLRRTLSMMYQDHGDEPSLERVEYLRYLLAEMLDIKTPIHILYDMLVIQKTMPLHDSGDGE